ncbi:MAG: hypothetical protein E7448_04785, partial [Ruminococcaceae bacterium]|nr:hypothetical protein [Oscillospiraceae bacterium]
MITKLFPINACKLQLLVLLYKIESNALHSFSTARKPRKPQLTKRGGILSMKLTKRMLSGLLVLVMVLSLCPVFTFAEEVTPVNVGTLGTAPQQAGLAGRDEAGSNVQYLSDLFSTGNMVESHNGSYKVTLDVNYNNDLYAFNAAGARRQIAAKADANGNRTLENGITYHKSEIALGYLGTKYGKGLGVVPNPEGAEDNYIVYSTAGLNVDRFYAVVGGTGSAITDPNAETAYVTFEVWGGATTDDFVKLAYVDNIRSYLVAEFNVDITGYNYIKLVYKMSEKSNHLKDGVNSNSGCQLAWGDACFYTSSGAPRVDLFEGLGKAPQQAGLPGVPSTAHNITYLSDLMGNIDYEVEHLGTNVANANYNGDLYTFSNGARKQIKASLDANGERTLDNGVTYKPTDIALGWNGVKYAKGIGVHPDAYNKADRYITFDVSTLNANRFYAVVGATGNTLTEGSDTSIKVTFEVWGGKYNSPSSFVKLAYADSIRSYVIAEMDVDITGYDYIKLVVKMTGTASNSSCAVAWGDALVYNDGYTATEGFTSYEEGNTDYVGYHDCAQPTKLADASKVMASYVMPKSGSTDPRAVGVNTAFNNTALKYIDVGNPSVRYSASQGATFLNLHLSGSTQPDTYVTLNVQGLGDRFYSLVGINGNAKATTDVGAVFRVYGSKAETYDVEAYELLATSGSIYGYATGEFDIDITGYNFLKLEVARPEGQTANSSGAVTWMEPTIYKNTLSHTEVVDEAVAPDCENTGLTAGSHCGVCGIVIVEQEEIPANDHFWNDGEITTAPGCESEGVKTYTCGTCGKTYTEAVAATGHTVVVDEAVAPDCENTGKTEGSHCSVCGTVIVEQEEIPANDHSWNDGEITTAPGCESEGVKTYTCGACGKTKTEAVSATGHTAGDAVTENYKDSTCTATGSYDTVVYCSVCGTELSRDTVVIPVKEHTIVEEKSYTPPTCITEGCNATYYYCTVCDFTYFAPEFIPALGHSEIEKQEIVAEATCELPAGIHVYYVCERCGEVRDVGTFPYGEPTGHTPGEPEVNVRDATCTVDGFIETVVPCATCGIWLSHTSDTIPATGHSCSYTDNSNGTHTYACAVCGDTATEAHSYTGNACACGHTLIDLIKSSQATLEAMLRLDFTVDKSLLTGEDNYV